ncbi:MAG: Fe-S protein assembly co-chaperone HscB [Gammaproteobacteria bacterium]|nr:Fe-S protein assembly co-chaperone HscB [Gammaproteobacteria bacterium]
MDISQDFFSCYGLVCDFSIDMEALRQTHRSLQQQHHPDRFVSQSDSVQRHAVQVTAYLNQAYATLSEPLLRGIYLLQLKGMDPLAPTNTQMPMDFLLQQIELRECLEDLHQAQDPQPKIDAMMAQLEAQANQLESDFAQAYASSHLDQAETSVRKLQFIVKLQQQLDALEGELLD